MTAHQKRFTIRHIKKCIDKLAYRVLLSICLLKTSVWNKVALEARLQMSKLYIVAVNERPDAYVDGDTYDDPGPAV